MATFILFCLVACLLWSQAQLKQAGFCVCRANKCIDAATRASFVGATFEAAFLRSNKSWPKGWQLSVSLLTKPVRIASENKQQQAKLARRTVDASAQQTQVDFFVLRPTKQRTILQILLTLTRPLDATQFRPLQFCSSRSSAFQAELCCIPSAICKLQTHNISAHLESPRSSMQSSISSRVWHSSHLLLSGQLWLYFTFISLSLSLVAFSLMLQIGD